MALLGRGVLGPSPSCSSAAAGCMGTSVPAGVSRGVIWATWGGLGLGLGLGMGLGLGSG